MANPKNFRKRLSSSEAFLTEGWQDRFWSNVKKRGVDDCWPWTASVTPNGYGAFRLGTGTHHASRVSLAIKIGRWPAKQEFACHSCDNPNCVNPNHLWLGDSKANTQDAAMKGRTHKWAGARRGEGAPNAKLSADQALRIMSLKGKTQIKQLCEEYGVSSGAITAIWQHRSWTHVTKPEGTSHDQ